MKTMRAFISGLNREDMGTKAISGNGRRENVTHIKVVETHWLSLAAE